jgi:hypothetical protein
VEDGAHGCDQCVLSLGKFLALGDKRKSPVQLIQKDLLMMHWISIAHVQQNFKLKL